MDRRDYNEAKQHLLHAAMILAPTGKVQSSISSMVNEIEVSEPSDKVRIMHLVGALYDGLRYGNWPKGE